MAESHVLVVRQWNVKYKDSNTGEDKPLSIYRFSIHSVRKMSEGETELYKEVISSRHEMNCSWVREQKPKPQTEQGDVIIAEGK